MKICTVCTFLCRTIPCVSIVSIVCWYMHIEGSSHEGNVYFLRWMFHYACVLRLWWLTNMLYMLHAVLYFAHTVCVIVTVMRGFRVKYLNRPDIISSAVIRGASLRQAEVSAFEDYNMQRNNMNLFPCYYSFCLEYRGSAHGSYYAEGLGVLFHREKLGWRLSMHYAQGLIFPWSPLSSSWRRGRPGFLMRLTIKSVKPWSCV